MGREEGPRSPAASRRSGRSGGLPNPTWPRIRGPGPGLRISEALAETQGESLGGSSGGRRARFGRGVLDNYGAAVGI